MRSPCTATKSSPCSLQLEKAPVQQRRPRAAKKTEKNHFNKSTVEIYGVCRRYKTKEAGREIITHSFQESYYSQIKTKYLVLLIVSSEFLEHYHFCSESHVLLTWIKNFVTYFKKFVSVDRGPLSYSDDLKCIFPV